MPRKLTNRNLELQAEIFGRYLLKKSPNKAAKALYIKAILNNAGLLDNKDQKLLKFVERHPRSIGLVDSGLPFLKPHSEVRRRLYIMFAILEASPQYYNHFLPRERSPFYGIFVLYAGARAILKAGFGILLVRLVA